MIFPVVWGPLAYCKKIFIDKIEFMIYFVTITPSNIYWNKIEIELGWVVRFVFTLHSYILDYRIWKKAICNRQNLLACVADTPSL